VLYTSGYTKDAMATDGRIDPGVALIHKPYRKIELARKIRAVLGTPSGTATQIGSEGCDELRRSS
jgi:hypothetical protein